MNSITAFPIASRDGLANILKEHIMDEKSANDPAKQKIDWREHHETQPYASGERSYEDFVPAYHTAQAAFAKHGGKKFEEVEDDVALDYGKHHPGAALPWDEARAAVQSAWDKLGGVISPRDPSRGIRSGF
jgi:hypothetical protein